MQAARRAVSGNVAAARPQVPVVVVRPRNVAVHATSVQSIVDIVQNIPPSQIAMGAAITGEKQ